jgi:RNA-directed DNA polymerase
MSTLFDLRSANTLYDIAVLLGFTPSGLSYTLYKSSDSEKYCKFQISKKSGGVRDISAPTGALKMLQRRLADLLYDCQDEITKANPREPLSHGFRRSQSIIDNAKKHKRRRYVLNLDLENFFPTFNFGRVRGFFIKNHDFSLNEKVATIVAQIACFENVLPQGSPCSPVIADMLAHILDVRLVRLAKKHKLTYSRYADDLTFSTNARAFPTALAFRDTEEPGSNWFT